MTKYKQVGTIWEPISTGSGDGGGMFIGAILWFVFIVMCMKGCS